MQVEVGPEEAMYAVVRLATEVIPGCAMAGVSIARRDAVSAGLEAAVEAAVGPA